MGEIMKVKNFIKENYKFIIVLILLVLFCTVKLPYYAMAPGGTINITDRVEMDNYQKNSEGSINMLYVSEYDMTPVSFIYAKLKGYEINSNEDKKISNESISEVVRRDKIMRDNSLDIATLVAYTSANKKINIKDKQNIVMATTNDNEFKVGDVILEVNSMICEEVDDIKKIIEDSEVRDIIKFKILRDGKELDIENKVVNENGRKVIGVVIITDYDYEIEPEINIKFKNSESGSSGGLMLTLTIYNAINDEDLIKGRNIAGTGTISYDGSVGEIDGIKYKIMGAASNDMDIVFVPSANYDDAVATKEKYDYDLEIIKVDTFEEVVNYLKNNE